MMMMYVAVNTTLLPPTHRPRLLVSGDANGVVKVWRLNTELTSQGSNEIEQLNTIALEPLSNASL